MVKFLDKVATSHANDIDSGNEVHIARIDSLDHTHAGDRKFPAPPGRPLQQRLPRALEPPKLLMVGDERFDGKLEKNAVLRDFGRDVDLERHLLV